MLTRFVTDSVRADLDAALVGRVDSTVTGGIFLERQLHVLLPQLLEAKLPALNAFKYLPMDRSVPAWAKTYGRQMLTPHGIAAWISNYATDLPQVGVSTEEETFKVKPLGASFGWSIDDLAAAMATGMPLNSRLALAARRAIEEQMNQTAWAGAPEVGLFGALTYPHFPRVALAYALDATSTPDQILGTLHGLVNGVHTRTKQLAHPTRMLMPPEPFEYIASTHRSSLSDKTILDAFKQTSRFITEIEPVHELEGAGENGEDLILVFEPSERVLGHVVPQLFSPQPVQNRNLSFQVPCIAKSGGVASDFPLEVAVGVLP